jgi:plasmid stability protein
VLSFCYLEVAMAQILVRDLDEEVVATLKERARLHRRSLQAEVKLLLEEAARTDRATARRRIEEVRRQLAGRPMGESSELVRELRDR